MKKKKKKPMFGLKAAIAAKLAPTNTSATAPR